jgi:GAF domain-containing protein
MKLRDVLLSPVMSVWRASLTTRLSKVPRPSDSPHAQAPGPDPDWILVLGNDIAAGWGVRSHDVGVPGHLSRELTRLSGHGTEVDVTLAADSAAIARYAATSTGARYDAIVVVGGVRDALHLRSPASWRAEMSRTLKALAANNTPHTHIVVMGIRRMHFVSRIDSWLAARVAAHAVTLNEITMELCATVPQVSYLDLPELPDAAHPGEHRAEDHYRVDAAEIAAHLLPFIHPEGSRRDGSRPSPANTVPDNAVERARQSAVDALPPLEDELGEEVDGLVAAAKAVYAASFASFSVVDHDQLDYRVVAGGKPRTVPRNESVCSIAMLNDGPTIVSDTARDARFRHIRGIRFYAGVPVMSQAGHRIGMLCVVDSEPRSADTFDSTMLRELAQLLQKRIWAKERDAD